MGERHEQKFQHTGQTYGKHKKRWSISFTIRKIKLNLQCDVATYQSG